MSVVEVAPCSATEKRRFELMDLSLMNDDIVMIKSMYVKELYKGTHWDLI
jgi:hypothetical protein